MRCGVHVGCEGAQGMRDQEWGACLATIMWGCCEYKCVCVQEGSVCVCM